MTPVSRAELEAQALKTCVGFELHGDRDAPRLYMDPVPTVGDWLEFPAGFFGIETWDHGRYAVIRRTWTPGSDEQEVILELSRGVDR